MHSSQFCILCGDGGHCSSIMGRPYKHDVSLHRRLTVHVIGLLGPRLATLYVGRVFASFPATCCLAVSFCFDFVNFKVHIKWEKSSLA